MQPMLDALRRLLNAFLAQDAGAIGEAAFAAKPLLPLQPTDDPVEKMLRKCCDAYAKGPSDFNATMSSVGEVIKQWTLAQQDATITVGEVNHPAGMPELVKAQVDQGKR